MSVKYLSVLLFLVLQVKAKVLGKLKAGITDATAVKTRHDTETCQGAEVNTCCYFNQRNPVFVLRSNLF